jgi:hypothetical protein
VLKDFVSEGILIVIREGGKGGAGLAATTEYRFDLNVLLALPSSRPIRGDHGTPQSRKTRVRGDRGAVRGDPGTVRGVHGTPKPSRTIKNHQCENSNSDLAVKRSKHLGAVQIDSALPADLKASLAKLGRSIEERQAAKLPKRDKVAA